MVLLITIMFNKRVWEVKTSDIHMINNHIAQEKNGAFIPVIK